MSTKEYNLLNMKAAEEGKANKIKIGSECMDIKRHVYQTLLKWKNDNCHTTLEVNGARQVGKTYIINKFADENFSHKVYINLFELSGEQFISCYQKACKDRALKLRYMMHFVCLMKIFQTQRTPLLS